MCIRIRRWRAFLIKSLAPRPGLEAALLHREALYRLSYRGAKNSIYLFFKELFGTLATPPCISRWQFARTKIHLSASAHNFFHERVRPREESPNSFVVPST